MEKGERTREAILGQAADLASLVGLSGLTIGTLASHTSMSKSGLFRHFGSKEALQVETLKAGVSRFIKTVIGPALKTERGLPRLTKLFDGWLEWTTTGGLSGGCLFVAASVELDDQPGAARDYLVATQREWLDLIATCAKKTIETGEFREDVDCDQFAHEFNAMLLAFHQANRLMRDPKAGERARYSFERLVADAASLQPSAPR